MKIVRGNPTEQEAKAVEKLVEQLTAASRAKAAGATEPADAWGRTAEQFDPAQPQFNPSAYRNIRYY